MLAFPQFAFGEEDDKPVKFEELPAAVAAAIKGAAGEAKLDTLVMGDEDGTPAYEASWQAGGHKHEIAVAKDGSVMGLEEIITLAETPEAVRAAMTKEAGGNKMLEVEKVLEKGKTTYEVTIQKGKTKEAVSFSEDGKLLERETPDEENADKKDKEDKDEEKDDEKDDDEKKADKK
jgi:uncharacterized protein YpmB